MYGNYLHPQENEDDNSQTGSFNLQSLMRSDRKHERRLGRSRNSGSNSAIRPFRMGESATKGVPSTARRNLGPMRMNAKVESFQSKMSDILTEEDAEEERSEKDLDLSLANAFGPLSLNKSFEESKTYGAGISPDSGSFTATSTIGQLENTCQEKNQSPESNSTGMTNTSVNTSLIGQLKTALGSDFTDKLPDRSNAEQRPMRLVTAKGPFRMGGFINKPRQPMRTIESAEEAIVKVESNAGPGDRPMFSSDKENIPHTYHESQGTRAKTVISFLPPSPPQKQHNPQVKPFDQYREEAQPRNQNAPIETHVQVKMEYPTHRFQEKYGQSQVKPEPLVHSHLHNPPKEPRISPQPDSLHQRMSSLAAPIPSFPSMKKTQSAPGIHPLPRTPMPLAPMPQATQPLPSQVMMPPPSMAMSQQEDTVLVVRNRRYKVMKLLGKGGSSRVYEAFDEEKKTVVAIKRVDLSDADEAQAAGYVNEIKMLSQLQGEDRIVKLYDHEKIDAEDILYVVMEKGDTDLSLLLKKYNANKEITSSMVKHYWTEMLHAVQVIHRVGIIHSDLKPANFLLVAGRLKLIDFGIASAVQSDNTSVIKDSQMGTFNFMSPEAIQDVATGPQYDASGNRKPCIKISIKTDVWSLGCILYNLAYGKMPFGEIRQPMLKLQAIVNPDHKINFPTDGQDPLLIDVLKSCLMRDPRERPGISELLQHPYVTGAKAEKDAEMTKQEKLSAINLVANLNLEGVLTPNTLDRTRKGLAEALKNLESVSDRDVLRKLNL